MEIDQIDPEAKGGGKVPFFVALGALVLFLSGASYYYMRGPSPFALLKEHSNLTLPAGSKALTWRADEGSHYGRFEIPLAAVPGFIESNGLKPDKIFAYSFSNEADRCSKDGKEEGLTLNNETGVLEIAIGVTDCTVGSGTSPAL